MFFVMGYFYGSSEQLVSDNRQRKIDSLNTINDSLFKVNDSLLLKNNKLKSDIDSIDMKMDSINKVIFTKDSTILSLEGRKTNIKDKVIKLTPNEIVNEFNKYLNEKYN